MGGGACDLALSNCHTCDKCTFKRSVIENDMRDNRTSKLNMACVVACAYDRTPFMTRSATIFTDTAMYTKRVRDCDF